MEDASPSLSDERHFGQVRWFTPQRGYGFILPRHAITSDVAARVFVHFRDVLDGEKYLRAGELVTYDLEERTDKPSQVRAVRVRRVIPTPRMSNAAGR